MFPGCVCSVCTWLQVYMCAHIFVHHVPMIAPVMSMHQACMHTYILCGFQVRMLWCISVPGMYVPVHVCAPDTLVYTCFIVYYARVYPHVELRQSFDSPSPCVSGTAPPIHEVKLVVLHPVNGHSPHGISCWLPGPSLRSVLGWISVEGGGRPEVAL